MNCDSIVDKNPLIIENRKIIDKNRHTSSTGYSTAPLSLSPVDNIIINDSSESVLLNSSWLKPSPNKVPNSKYISPGKYFK